MAWTLSRADVNSGSNVELGKIQTEEVRKASGIIKMPEALGDSPSARMVDFAGTILQITLSGIIIDNTGATGLATKAQNLLAFINGDQSTTASYNSDILGAKNVKILDVTGNYDQGLPTIYRYTLILVESSTDI